jgi:hypothetical protein
MTALGQFQPFSLPEKQSSERLLLGVKRPSGRRCSACQSPECQETDSGFVEIIKECLLLSKPTLKANWFTSGRYKRMTVADNLLLLQIYPPSNNTLSAIATS